MIKIGNTVVYQMKVRKSGQSIVNMLLENNMKANLFIFFFFVIVKIKEKTFAFRNRCI